MPFRSPPCARPVSWPAAAAAAVVLAALFAGAREVRADAPTGLKLRRVAEGFRKPIQAVFPPDSAQLYVVEQGGRILRWAGGKRTVFADLTDRIEAGSSETGLLSLAFAPDYRENRPTRVYLNFTPPSPLRTVVAEYPVAGNPPRLVTGKERRLLEFKQPWANHNGGHILFGPDRMLYIATGDGGAGGDPLGSGQKQDTLLGKILRIDPAVTAGRPYGIPRDNPFRGIGSYRPEIFATGLRNPWRISFDRATGKLYAGDVGQNRQEEINLIRPGDNLGWNTVEGELCYKPAKACKRGGLVAPLHVYGRDQGVSVTGGYVYRGKALGGWQGQYFFADFGSGRVWSFPVGRDGRRAGAVRLHFNKAGNISSFGEDDQGELYLVRYRKGDVVRIER